MARRIYRASGGGTEVQISAWGGTPLQAVSGLDDLASALAGIGVTDAEQVLGIAAVPDAKDQLATTLGIESKALDDLLKRLRTAVPPQRRAVVEEAAPADLDLGALRPPEEELERSLDLPSRSVALAQLPASVNWIRELPPVRNPAGRGTCVSFTLTAVQEFVETGQDFSEQHLYYETKLIDGAANACGTWQSKAAEALQQVGQCRESVWPYNPTSACNDHGPLPSNARPDAAGHKLTCQGLNPRDVDAIKQALSDHGLVGISIPVYNSWYQSASTRLTGRITMPLSGEPEVGGHAVALVGYQDDATAPGGGTFILRNSWSTSWASQSPFGAGYGTIPYGYLSAYNWEAYTAPSAQAATHVPLHRYWNPGNADHFYTTDWNELGGGNYGWGYEGVQCYVRAQAGASTVPLYRYWNSSIGDHFYTTDWNELGYGRYGWGFEGVQCHVYPQQVSGSVPLYRYWNASAGDHFYTTNWSELGYGLYGWGYEGVQCYVMTRADAPAAMEGSPATAAAEQVPETFRAGSGTAGVAGGEGPRTDFAALGDGQSETPVSFRVQQGADTAGTPATFSVRDALGGRTLNFAVSLPS